MTIKEKAIYWWNRRNSTEKKELIKFYKNSCQSSKSLTNSEIEQIYKLQPYV